MFSSPVESGLLSGCYLRCAIDHTSRLRCKRRHRKWPPGPVFYLMESAFYFNWYSTGCLLMCVMIQVPWCFRITLKTVQVIVIVEVNNNRQIPRIRQNESKQKHMFSYVNLKFFKCLHCVCVYFITMNVIYAQIWMEIWFNASTIKLYLQFNFFHKSKGVCRSSAISCCDFSI